MIIVTGGRGFIGSNFILDWLDRFDEQIINIDIMNELNYRLSDGGCGVLY